MKPVLFVVACAAMYGCNNFIISRKLAGVSPTVNVFIYCGGIALLAVPMIFIQKKLGYPIVTPTREQMCFLVLCAFICACADLCFFSAHNSGGSLAMITMSAVLIPVFAIFYQCVADRVLPTPKHLVAIVLATIALYLVSDPAKQPG